MKWPGNISDQEDPLGKSLLYENKWPLKITGLVKKMPLNSDIRFDFLVSLKQYSAVEPPAWADFIKNDWTFTPCETWILSASPDQYRKKLIRH